MKFIYGIVMRSINFLLQLWSLSVQIINMTGTTDVKEVGYCDINILGLFIIECVEKSWGEESFWTKGLPNNNFGKQW